MQTGEGDLVRLEDLLAGQRKYEVDITGGSIANVSAQGGGFILLSRGNMNNSRIVPKSGVFLVGADGYKTTFKTDINRVAVYQDISTEDLQDFGIFNCRFVGGVTEYPTQPQHFRSGTGTGMTT